MRKGQFKKGGMPHNKGKKGWTNKGSFKDGHKDLVGKRPRNWRGGRTMIGEYVYLGSPNHPNKNSGGYVAEHRLVMEKKIGRYLTSNEEVHHINGIKDDNRIENLELVIKERHFGEVVCPYCLKKFKVK